MREDFEYEDLEPSDDEFDIEDVLEYDEDEEDLEEEDYEEEDEDSYSDDDSDDIDGFTPLSDEELEGEDDGLDELSREFVGQLVEKIMSFMKLLVGHELHAYQKPLARRIIESVIINDGEEITALASRQSGKSETVADTVATLMVILPRDRKSTRLNSSHTDISRMPSSA